MKKLCIFVWVLIININAYSLPNNSENVDNNISNEIEITGFYGQKPHENHPNNLSINATDTPNVYINKQQKSEKIYKSEIANIYNTKTLNAPNKELNICFDIASKQYNIPKGILLSIASVESKFNTSAINKNKNGSYDLGIMQINSSWFLKLLSMGITESSLHYACQNISIGAWILANNFKSYGYGWEAIQRYNGHDTQLKYARKVYEKIVEYDPSLISKNAPR